MAYWEYQSMRQCLPTIRGQKLSGLLQNFSGTNSLLTSFFCVTPTLVYKYERLPILCGDERIKRQLEKIPKILELVKSLRKLVSWTAVSQSLPIPRQACKICSEILLSNALCVPYLSSTIDIKGYQFSQPELQLLGWL